jgi:chromosome segregation ATPase
VKQIESSIIRARQHAMTPEMFLISQVIGDVIGTDVNAAFQMLTLNFDATQELTLVVDLHGGPASTKPLAAEAADRAVDELQRLLNPEHVVAQIEDAKQAYGLAQRRREESRQRMEGAQQELANQTGAVDVSPATIRQLLSSLQTQRETVQIDLAAKQARRDALAEQISKFSEQIRAKVRDDPVATELEKVVAFKEEGIEQKKKLHEQGQVSNSELSESLGAVAEARAKLFERREQAALAAGGDILSGWNKELMTLTVDLAELQARAKSIDERLFRFNHTSDALRELDEYQQTLAEQKRQLNEMEQRLNEAEMNYARHHVGFTVISSKDDPAPATQPAQ